MGRLTQPIEKASPIKNPTSEVGFRDLRKPALRGSVLVRPNTELIVPAPPFWGKRRLPTRLSRTDASPRAVHVTYTHHRRGESGRWIGATDHRRRLQGQFRMPFFRAYTTQGEGAFSNPNCLGGRGGLPSNRPSNLG